MQSDTPGIKRQAEILVTGKPEAFGRLVSEVIEAGPGRTYDLRVTFAEHVDELLRLVRDREFDVFIVIADDISFSYETSKPSREGFEVSYEKEISSAITIKTSNSRSRTSLKSSSTCSAKVTRRSYVRPGPASITSETSRPKASGLPVTRISA